MKYQALLFAALASLLALTPVSGQAPAAPPEPQAERTVCKGQMQTGTRFKKRTCRTAKEWEELAERARREGQEMISKASALAQVRQNGPT